jgi:endonuclease/exonuclease/phosphatase family metal-dependent hydrolase
MSFDPHAPYGPLVESTIRVVTWNVWGRYGPDPEARQAALEQALEQAKPDLVCLVEAWRQGDTTQPARIAARLGLPHHTFAGDREQKQREQKQREQKQREQKQQDWVSGIGFVSRWPMTAPRRCPLRAEDGSGSGEAVHVAVAAERGPIQLFAVLLDYPLDASGLRQHQVRQLVRFIAETASRRDLVVVCGDFNAGPDSDEIRMLTGRSAPAAPGMVFYDAWELAGDDSPGFTWSNRNPLAAAGLYPDRRFDYIFTAWPRRGGVGHPVRCSLLGVRVPGDQQISDHYGLTADLRY